MIEPAIRHLNLVAGVDEVGRGCLAGPVYAAAVILDPKQPISGLRDSKKLSLKQREALYAIIKKSALSWSLGIASVTEIEQFNILQASLMAMERAVDQLTTKPRLVLIDGNQKPKRIPYNAQCIIGGDDKIDAIRAASIVAKVSRDRYMQELDALYPDYAFSRHKGYPTRLHRLALRRLGPTQHHRRTFSGVILA